MDTARAVTVPTIVAANHQATSASTNAINVNQSNNSHLHSNTNPHPHILTAHSSNSVSNSNSNSNSNINSSIINSSLIISSNSSSSSSSSSSASSGYGSTSATPTNSYETHTAATTPVVIAEPIIPIATVAAVSPYFSESVTTQAREGQHYVHHQQQQQHVNPHPHQQHPPQSQIQHHQLQQNLQHTQRQQYYSTTYDYQQQQLLQHQQQPTHQQQQQQSHNLPLTYNMGTGSPATDSGSSAASSSGGVAYQGVGQYKPTDVGSMHYERNLTGRSASGGATAAAAGAVTATTLNYQHSMQQQIPNEPSSKHLTQSQHQQQQFLNATSSSKSRSASSLLGSSSSSSSSSSTTAKPQAAATPFYAQPLAQQSNNSSSFYDNLKHKMPLDYHDNFVNFPNAAAYHQQQKYYAAAKSQLKEASTYGSPPGLIGKSLYPNANTYYSGPTGQHASSGYDKYMYPSAYSSLAYESPPDPAYRKGNTTGSINSHSWPWGIDYASGNSRTIPPPTGHLPTATVAPTHASYLTANTSHLARDPYYVTHDKYGMKYDKYPPPYQQTYVSPTATRHHLWPGTHSALSERLPPPPHTLHSTPYYSANAPSVLNARQSYCTQPYQPQSCYYPPTRLPPHGQSSAVAQTSAYMGTAQPTAHPHQPHMTPLNSSCKYGSVIDYGAANKLKNPNDLYVSTRYDPNPPPPPPHLTHSHSYNYGTTAVAASQLYNPNQIHHGAQPAGPLITHESLVNTPNFTNDLSLTSNTFDSYVHEPPHINPQGLGLTSGPTAPTYAPVTAKRALLDYRKPIQQQPQPQPPAPIQEECFGQAQNVLPTSNRAGSQYQSTDLLNTPETTTFIDYDTHTQTTGFAAEESPDTLEQAGKSSEETTKNLSLRDFIANWNDDEDEYGANEDMGFDQSTVINEVLKATTSVEPVPQPVSEPSAKGAEVPTLLVEKASTPESISKVSEVASEAVSPAEMDSSQYINLPDIIIDIEKSNVNTSITTPPIIGDDDASILLDNFDVEKELDQLQLRKNGSDSITAKPNNDINSAKDFKHDISPNREPTKFKDSRDPPKASQISFDDFHLEQTKAVLPTRPATTDHPHPAPPPEQLLKDIEGYDSGNSRHSNESSLFEKEYETFINKITTIVPNTKSESDFEQNVKEFSKFYKRKRKLRDEEAKSPQCPSEDEKKLKSSDAEKAKTSNFPQVYTKKSRNRRVSAIHRLKQNQLRRRKPLSVYYKLIHSLRRYRRYRSKRVRDYITELKEKHLPLIKRQSIKNYSIAANRQALPLFSPQSLKTLLLSVINSEVFRHRVMNLSLADSAESEEKHICTDPACETCEVIRSLMEPEAFECSIVEQENIVGESAKSDVSNKEEVIYMEKPASQPSDEELSQIDSQLTSELVIKPTRRNIAEEVDTKLVSPYSITNEAKETLNIKTDSQPVTSVSNDLKNQHVEDHMEVQDLSLPQNKCRLTSVVKNTSQLGCSRISLENTPYDSEHFPEDLQCSAPSVVFTQKTNSEITTVIQATSVISTDGQNEESNFETIKLNADSKQDYAAISGMTSDETVKDNTKINVLLAPEITSHTSSVIQKTSVIRPEVQNDDSNSKTSGAGVERKQEYPVVAEILSNKDKAAETLKTECEDLEIGNHESEDENDIKSNDHFNKNELDSDSESESSECDTDCSCSSCSSSESSDGDDQDKSRTSSDSDAEEVTQNNSTPKKENLKRKPSKADTESCAKVIILSGIDSPKKCKVDAEKSGIKPHLNEVVTITTLSNAPEPREGISENRISEAENSKSNSFNEEPIARNPEDIAVDPKGIKSPDRSSDELRNCEHLSETIDISDSGDSSEDDDNASESEDEAKAKTKSTTHKTVEEKYSEVEANKCKSKDSENDTKVLSDEEDDTINKEGVKVIGQIQNEGECRNEINSPDLTNNGKLNFPQASESSKPSLENVTTTNVSCDEQSSYQSLGGSNNDDVEQVAADIPDDRVSEFSQDSYQSFVNKIQEHSSLLTDLEKNQENSLPREHSILKSFHTSTEDVEKCSPQHPSPEKDEAVVSNNAVNEEDSAMGANTIDIYNIEPLDYSTAKEDKVEGNKDRRSHSSNDNSSSENSRDKVLESDPVRPRIILSIKRTPEVVDTTKDANSSVEFNTEPKSSYEKYYYTTKFKSSNFANDCSDESQSSFGTENDESEIDEKDEAREIARSNATRNVVVGAIDSRNKCKFSPSAHIFSKDSSLSSKDFNSLNLSEIDERMGDLFPQSSFGRGSPIFDIREESRLSAKSDVSVNVSTDVGLQSLQIPEDHIKSPNMGLSEPSAPSLKPSLIPNTTEFVTENCSILEHQNLDEKHNFIQSATVIMDNSKDPNSSAGYHRNSDPTDVSQNMNKDCRNPCTRDDPGGQEYCKDNEQSIATNCKLPVLIKNMPEETGSSDVLESQCKGTALNKENSVLVHTDEQHQQHSEDSVGYKFFNDCEKPQIFEEDADATSKGSDSHTDSDNENLASEVQELQQHDDCRKKRQLIQNTYPEKYLAPIEDNDVNILDSSSSSAASIEEYVNAKGSYIIRGNDDYPESSMWNRVSVISFSHSTTEASDMLTNEEVNSQAATTDKSLDIFDELVNSNLVNAISEEQSDSNISIDDSMKLHIKRETDNDVDKYANDLGNFNFHSIFGNLEKLVDVKGNNAIVSNQILQDQEVRDTSADHKGLQTKEVSFESTSITKGTFHDTNSEVSGSSTSHNESIEERILISPVVEKQNSFQEANSDQSGTKSVIVISDSPESPVNEVLLLQNETTAGTELNEESQTSAEDNSEFTLTLSKVVKTTEAKQVNETPPETVSLHQNMSLLNPIKPDVLESESDDPLEETPATSAEDKNEPSVKILVTVQNMKPSSPTKSETNEEYEVKTEEEAIEENSASQPTLSPMQSSPTNDKVVGRLENIAAETFDIQKCMSPLSLAKTDASIEDGDIKPLQQPDAEIVDPTQLPSCSNPTKPFTLSDAEVESTKVEPEASFTSHECHRNLQSSISEAKEVVSVKELHVESFVIQKSSSVQPKSGIDIQEEHIEDPVISEQTQSTLSPKKSETLSSKDDVTKVNSGGDNEELADNLQKTYTYFEDFNKKLETQDGMSDINIIPEQCPTTLIPQDDATNDNCCLSPMKADSLSSKDDVTTVNCEGNDEDLEHNLQNTFENCEDFNKKVETQKGMSETTTVPEQSSTTMQTDTFRSQDDATNDNYALSRSKADSLSSENGADNEELADNLQKTYEHFEDFNKKVETQAGMSEINIIPEQSPTKMETDTLRPHDDATNDNRASIPRKADSLSSEDDVATVNCTCDREELADNLQKPNEYCEDVNKKVETQEEVRENTLSSEPSPAAWEVDTLRTQDDVTNENSGGDKQEVTVDLHKPNNKEVETQEELPDKIFVPEQIATTLSPRGASISEPNKCVSVGNCDIGHQEVAEYAEDFSINSATTEPIVELPVYPRFGRFKNYRSRNLETYNENKINENSKNSNPSSPKAENQCQHHNREKLSSYRGLVEERVTDSPPICCEKTVDELSNVCSPVSESVIGNAIECAEFEDQNKSPGLTNLSDQSEPLAAMGPATPQPEGEESLSSEQLQLTENIAAPPTEAELEDSTLPKSLITESEDTAEGELERNSPVDTPLSPTDDFLHRETVPDHDSLMVSTAIIEETTATTTQDKTSTTDDMSTDFLGFKNQSSFEDESGDFHGFEDQHEEERIRREIENINDDSAANDAFSYLGLHGNTSCLSGSMSSDLNELEALEKELTQHRQIRDQDGQDEAKEDAETDQHLVSASNVSISTNDIEHIKKMLESDEEHVDNDECKDNSHKDDRKSKLIALGENIRVSNALEIPKLSDLCRAALNSSLIVNNLTTVQSSKTTSPIAAASSNALVVERELSVEEALAEMYRQAGVLLSDPEDTDNEKPITNEEAQDVLLINLQEILNSDNDNVYVLQCDMNVNVQETNNENHSDDGNQNGHGTEIVNANDTAERVNTLQLIGILNTDFDNPEIHIISSDSESEVIILSDCDTDVELHSEPFSPPPPPSSKSAASISTREYIPFIDDLESNDDSQSDLSTIHHEEIVPDNLNKFLKEEFYRYLHEKYAQKKLSKYYHANRVLRKYKNRYSNKFRQ